MSNTVNTEAETLNEEQVRLWDGLEHERVSRIAGDDANNALSLQIQDDLSDTEGRLSTEVIHREQGDLNNIGTLTTLSQALSDYRIKTDLEINAEKIARQQLGVNLNATVNSATASFDHRELKLYQTINDLKAEYYDDHAQLDDRISKYEEMLQDITTDSIQITMDNGDIRMGAWTILSQAREWDLEILGKVKGFQESTTEDIDQALKEIQNKLPVEEDIINKLIEGLSEAPFIKNLSDELSSVIEDLTSLEVQLAHEAAERQRELINLAAQQAEALAAEKQELLGKLVKESQDRVDAIEREADIRNNQLLDMAEQLAQQLSDSSDATRESIETDLANIRNAIKQETEDRIARIKDLEDGFTKSVEELVEGDKTILSSLETYKKSNDSVLSSVSTEIKNVISDQEASASRVDAIDLRLKTNEGVAATAVSKAEAAITENSAQAKQIDSINVSLSDKVGSSAMSVLEANVTKIDGLTVSQGKKITALEADYANISDAMDTKVSTDAFSSLTTEVRGLEDSVETQTTDITSLKGEMETVKGDLNKKATVDAVNDLTVRMVEEEGKSSVTASELTKLKANLDTTNRNVNTKASTEAVNALTADVVSIGDKTTVNTSDITKLNSSLSKVEGALEKKFDASAIKDYYTKVQSDDKADQIAAGKIESFGASLMVGGDNVLKGSNVPIVSRAGAAKYYLGSYAAGLKSSDMVGKRFTLTACITVKNVADTQYLCAYQSGTKQILFKETALTKNADKAIVHAVFDWTIETSSLNFYLYPNRAADSTNAEVTIHWAVMTEGESIKAASWIPSSIETADSLDANAKAIQSTNSEVSRVDGRVNVTNSDVTKLTGRLSKVEGGLETKASVEAFQSLTTDIKSNKDAIAINTNSITKLGGSLDAVEKGLAKKLDSSVISEYYTKNESDKKMDTVAAGKVEEFKANLVIGGVNLIPNSFDVSQYSNDNSRYPIEVAVIDGVRRFRRTGIASNTLSNYTGEFVDLPVGTEYTLSVKVKPIGSDYSLGFYGAGASAKLCKADQWTTLQATIKAAVQPERVRALASSTAQMGVWVEVKEWQAEIGNKATAWSPSPEDFKNSIDANAKALQSTNSEVTRVDGKTTVNANNISGLTSRIGNVEGKVATKAEASALQDYYTKTEADTNSTTVAAGEVSKYDASLVIGGSNLLLNSNFTTGPSLTNWSSNGGGYTKVADNLQGSVVQTNLPNGLTHSWLRLENGVEYVYSALIKPTNAITMTVSGPLHYWAGLNSVHQNKIQVLAKSHDEIPANTWTRIWIKFKLTSDANSFKPFIYGGPANVVQLAWTQLELGSKATDWKPNNKEVLDLLDANASAIKSTNSEVVRVDGRVTATNTDITALKGSLTTTNNNIALKADQSAVTALAGRVAETEGGLTSANSNITSLKSSIAGTAESITANGSQATLDVINVPAANALLSVNADSMTGSVVKLKGAVSTNVTNTKLLIDPTKLYKLRMRYRRTAGTTNRIYIAVINYNAAGTQTVTQGNELNPVGTLISNAIYPISYELPALNVWREVEYYFKGKSTGGSTGSGTLASPRTFPALAASVDIGVLANYQMGTTDLTQEYEIDYLIFEDAADSVNAEAITSTNSEVSRINGKVNTHSTQLAELTASLAGKASADALSTLKAAVEDVEGKYTSQAQSITDLKASVKDTLDTVTIKDVRSTNELPIFYWTNYRSRRVNEFKYQTAIGVSSFFSDTYCNLETLVYWTDASGGPIIQTATSGSDPSLYVQRQSSGSGANAVWTAWKQPIKDLRDTLADKASASAVSTLDAKVVKIDGRVDTQASQITTLTTDNNNNKNALSIQAKVINGVKANYMVKMETNGVIGGFGMVQEATGALGTITTTFGVNADNFFIGAPAGGKKPFIVTTSTQTINGVSYPAGTWIDVALIANATIGTAKIADLAVTGAKIANATIDNAKIANVSAEKITAGTINAARIGANSITADKINVTSLSAISGNLGTLTSVASDGSKTVMTGGKTEVFYPNGKIAVRLGIW